MSLSFFKRKLITNNKLDQDFKAYFSAAVPNIRKGRNVGGGYKRGYGLQFGDLKKMIHADPLYQEALALAAGRTIQSEDNRMNIYLLIKFFLRQLKHGDIVEYGSYKGGSAIFMAKACSVLHPEMKVYAFDTFSGMPDTDAKIDAHRAGDFKDVDYDELVDYAASLGLANLKFVRGYCTENIINNRGHPAGSYRLRYCVSGGLFIRGFTS